jgi:predicted nucleic acid-binding protein
MVIADTSVVIRWLAGEPGRETDLFAELLAMERVRLAPVTVTELLSHVHGGAALDEAVAKLAVIPLAPGYWERAGRLRATVRRAGRKAALGDALVAQACIDAGAPLLATDRDFRAFAELGGLRLA